MTFAIVIGSSGGFYFNNGKQAKRINIGLIAFDFVKVNYVKLIADQNRELFKLRGETEC